MQPAKEQAILSYFKSPDEAQIASERLTDELDIEDVQIDRISGGQPGEGIENFMNPITANISSHASLIDATDPSGPSVGRLLGGSEVISGMADGSMGETISGRDILLTVIVPSGCVDRALQIITECGGIH